MSLSYCKADVVSALRQVGVRDGGCVFCHVSLGRLGYAQEGRTVDVACRVLYDALREAVGPSGTVMVPTYTYSVGRREVYDVQESPSTIGPFTEWFRNRPGVLRSRDPMLAVCVEGPLAGELLHELPMTCYGPGSIYERMRRAGTVICTVGLAMHWATFRHHIEELAAVPFRFLKMFTGYIRDKGSVSKERWAYFASPLIDNCMPMGQPLADLAISEGLCLRAPLGLGAVFGIDAETYFRFGVDALRREPWLSAKGPALDDAALVRAEQARMRVPVVEVELRESDGPGETIRNIARMPRDTVSHGVEAVLKSISGCLNGTISSYRSGLMAGGLVVPEQWVGHRARILLPNGTPVADSQNGTLQIASYSQAFSGRVTRETLLAHVHSRRDLPQALPHVSLREERDWGVIMTDELKNQLGDTEYDVEVDIGLGLCYLKVCECLTPGDLSGEVIVTATLGHAGSFNHGPSGAVLLMDMVRRVRSVGRSTRRSLRLVIAPDALGLAIHANQALALNAEAAFALHVDLAGCRGPGRLLVNDDRGTPTCVKSICETRGVSIGVGTMPPCVDSQRLPSTLGGAKLHTWVRGFDWPWLGTSDDSEKQFSRPEYDNSLDVVSELVIEAAKA